MQKSTVLLFFHAIHLYATFLSLVFILSHLFTPKVNHVSIVRVSMSLRTIDAQFVCN